MENSRETSLVEELPVPQRLALSYAPRSLRRHWLALFSLDARLSRIVSRASEPMLAQMRLAWWRDELAKPIAMRPDGDALLDLIGESWVGREQGLSALVDGWEYLLAEGELTAENAQGFFQGRAEAISAIEDSGKADGVYAEARYWAAVDLLARLTSEDEELLVNRLIEGFSEKVSGLSRGQRPLLILSGLARRAVRNGEREILGSRTSVVAGIRLGLLGR